MLIEAQPNPFRPDFLSPERPGFRPLTKDYSIVPGHQGEYIIDNKGNRFSDFYPIIHRYTFEDDQYIANFILGGSGDIWRALSYNSLDKENPWFLGIGDWFNSIHVEPKLNYKVIGTRNTFGYILDDQFRSSHYQGYHGFRWDKPTDTYYGMIIGRNQEKINFFDH